MNQKRQQNYDQALAILDGTYLKSIATQKKSAVINQEVSRILELDDQYEKAIYASENAVKAIQQEISLVEEEAAKTQKIYQELATSVQNLVHSRNQDKLTTKREVSKDLETYTAANQLLQERIQKAEEKLDEIQEIINGFQSEKIFHNTQAQELYLQLRSLLSAQDKELHSLEPH